MWKWDVIDHPCLKCDGGGKAVRRGLVLHLTGKQRASIYLTTWLKSPASLLFTQSYIQTQIKENIKAPRHWPLWGEFTAQMASNADNVSIWWRHHVIAIHKLYTNDYFFCGLYHHRISNIWRGAALVFNGFSIAIYMLIHGNNDFKDRLMFLKYDAHQTCHPSKYISDNRQ